MSILFYICFVQILLVTRKLFLEISLPIFYWGFSIFRWKFYTGLYFGILTGNLVKILVEECFGMQGRGWVSVEKVLLLWYIISLLYPQGSRYIFLSPILDILVFVFILIVSLEI